LAEEEHPEDHPGDVVRGHDPDLEPEPAPVRPRLQKRGAQGGQRDGHPPTTSSRRSPARKTPPAQASRATSHAACASRSHGSTCPDASRAGAYAIAANGSAFATSASPVGRNSSGSSIPPSRNTSFWYRNHVDRASRSQKAAPANACCAARLQPTASRLAGTKRAMPAALGGGPT